MVGCLLVIGAMLMPRVLLFVYWVTGSFRRADAWDTWVWPLLGFVFLPATTLAYGLCQVYGGGDFGFWWTVAMVVAVLYDLGAIGAGGSKSRRR